MRRRLDQAWRERQRERQVARRLGRVLARLDRDCTAMNAQLDRQERLRRAMASPPPSRAMN